MNRLVLLTSLAALTACAAGTPPPQIALDDEMAPAVIEPPPRHPVEIVTLPELLPLPGQLKPLERRREPRSATTRVEHANRAARQEPSGERWINAVQVYPFSPGALYRIYAAPEQVTDLALQSGEKLIAVSAGDTVRWIIGDTTSGSGEGEQVHVLVKPMQSGLQTNLVITTDRRAYHLELASTPRAYMAGVSWSYPQDQLMALRRHNARAEAGQGIERGLAVERLRFRYEITGDTPPWRPLRAFDDGSKVFIQFPARIDQGEAPPLFVVGPGGGAELVNYRVRANYYVVDRLFAAAELRLGAEPQAIVRIARTDGVAGARAP